MKAETEIDRDLDSVHHCAESPTSLVRDALEQQNELRAERLNCLMAIKDFFFDSQGRNSSFSALHAIAKLHAKKGRACA